MSASGHYIYLLLLIGALFSSGLGVVIWRERANLPGSKALIAQLWGVAIWGLGYALELVEPDLPSKVLWAKVEYIGITTIPVVWLLFVLEYFGVDFAIKRVLRYVIWLVPIITLGLVWTNGSHGLIWRRLWLQNSGDLVIMMVEHGTWFWVHLAFSYGLLLASTLLTIRMIVYKPSKSRLDGPSLLASVMIPWIGNGLYLLGLSPIPGLDLTPFAFTISTVLLAWGVLDLQIFQIRPLAYERIVESMPDLMFVLDDQDHLVEANPAACAIYDLPNPIPSGYKHEGLLGVISDISQNETRVNVDVYTDSSIIFVNDREYEVHVSSMHDTKNRQLGKMVLMRDVTHHRRSERRLKIQYAVSRILMEAANLGDAAQPILQLICTNLSWGSGGLWVNDHQARELHLVDFWSQTESCDDSIQAISKVEVSPGSGPIGKMCKTGKPVWLAQLPDDLTCPICSFALGSGWRSGLFIPVSLEGENLGVMAFFDENMPQPVDLLYLFNAVSNQISQFIERRRVEQTLHEEEAKYKSLVNQLPVGVYRTSVNGQVLHANPAIANILGYDSPEEVLEKVNTRDLYENPLERDRQHERWKANSGISSDVVSFHTHDGRRIWLRDTGRVILGADGEIAFIDGIVEDITEQKKFEDNLRESENRFRELFNEALQQARELNLLGEVRTTLARELDLKAIFHKIVETVANTFGYKFVSLYSLKGEVLELQHQVGYTHTLFQIPIHQGIVGRVARTGQAVLVKDVQADADYLEALHKATTEVCIPLVDHSRVVGVLNAESDDSRPLDEDDLRILSDLGQHLSVAIERARLFTEARDNEQKFRNVIEHSVDGIALVSEQGDIIEWNKGQERITGLVREQVLGNKIWEVEHSLLPPAGRTAEALQTIKDLIGWVMMDEKDVAGEDNLEITILRPDGALRNLQMALSPIKTTKGNMLSIVMRDVTERRQAAEALKRRDVILDAVAFAASQFLKESNWEECIQPVLDLLAVATRATRVYVYQNRNGKNGELTAIQKYAWENSFASDSQRLLPPKSIRYTRMGLKGWIQKLETGEGIFEQVTAFSEKEMKLFAGRTVRSIALVPIFVGVTWWGFIGFEDCRGQRSWLPSEIEGLKVAADILGNGIKRSDIEKALRQSEEQNKAMLDAIPDIMYRFTPNGTITGYQNNHQGNNLVGKNIKKLLSRDTWKLTKESIAKALETKEIQMFEFENKGPDGTFCYEARLAMCGEQELLGIVRDVSQRARLEQMKSDFINRAAHDLRTPLTTITMMTDLISEGGSEEELAQYWQVLQTEIRRERDLIETLLTVGRLESDRYQYHRQELPLAPILREALEGVRSVAYSRSIELVAVIPEDLPRLLCDSSALQQVFLNLLTNAVKFTPSSGTVRFEAQASGKGVDVIVKDTGIGIPPADIPNLFQRFYRASNAIENEIQGTGVGLFIVKSIVEQHGGQISVESLLQVGTTFTVWLPHV